MNANPQRTIFVVSCMLFFFFVQACSLSDSETAIRITHQQLGERGYLPKNALQLEVHTLLQGEIHLDQAVAISFVRNPSLQALYKRLGAENAELSQAFLPDNPSLSLERRFPGQAAELDVAQEFLSLLLLPMRRDISEAEFESRRNLLAQELASHAVSVRRSFFEYQANLELRDFRRRIVSARQSDLLAAEALFRAGNRSQLELLQSQRENTLADAELLDLEIEVQKSREDLHRLLGAFPDERAWTVAPRLPSPLLEGLSEEDLETRAIRDRFDMQSLRAEVKAFEERQAFVNIVSRIPSLSLTGHSEREPDGDSSFGPSIVLPLPIFNFGGTMRTQARLQLEEAQHRLQAKELEVRWEVRKHFSTMVLLSKKIELFRSKLLPTQKRITSETQLRYNGMFLGVFDLLEAKQKEIESGEAQIRNLLEYWRERCELEAALGWRLLDASVSETESPEAQDSSSHHMHHHGGH